MAEDLTAVFFSMKVYTNSMKVYPAEELVHTKIRCSEWNFQSSPVETGAQLTKESPAAHFILSFLINNRFEVQKKSACGAS